jgi:hypothetical protein
MQLLIADEEPQTRAALSELCGRSDALATMWHHKVHRADFSRDERGLSRDRQV